MTEATLHEQVEQIVTREDLAGFIERLALDYARDPNRWGNTDLASYFGGLAGWVADMDGYFENRQMNLTGVPIWRLVGIMLLAATSYE